MGRLIARRPLVRWLGAGTLAIGLGHAAAAERLEVEATEFAFAPETMTVTSGEQVTLVLQNQGAVAHNIAVEAVDAESDTVQTGSEAVLAFTAPEEPGEYEVICSVPGHADAGMMATLIVE